MLVTTSWVDELKDLLGMEAVSQIWGEVPAWYMWLSEAHGVYRLQLSDAMNDENNPNGSQLNIAGIVNKNGNVMGMMPHPERACDPTLGRTDGQLIFKSIANYILN